jgi:hypothetical protein
VSLYLLSINELSETTETLKTTAYLWITWYDEFLQWDPSDYGGIDYYHWPQVKLSPASLFNYQNIIENNIIGLGFQYKLCIYNRRMTRFKYLIQ